MFSAIASFLLAVSAPSVHCFCSNETNNTYSCAAYLVENLLKDYDTLYRPSYSQTSVIDVEFSYAVVAIHSLSTRDQVLTSTGFSVMIWQDEFLRWNASDYGNTQYMILVQQDIWTPQIIVENSAKAHDNWGGPDTLILVYPDGQVIWATPHSLETTCKLDITKFPFDSQHCTIDFVTWMEDDHLVTMKTFENILHEISEISAPIEWDITAIKLVRDTFNLSYIPHRTSQTLVRCDIHLVRRRAFYVLNFLIPVMLLSTLNVLVFILPADCGERMGLAITVLLAFTFYLSVISDNIPRASETKSILTIYLTLLLTLSTTSVTCAGIVLNIHYRDIHRDVPPWLANFCLKSCYFQDHEETLAEMQQSTDGRDSALSRLRLSGAFRQQSIVSQSALRSASSRKLQVMSRDDRPFRPVAAMRSTQHHRTATFEAKLAGGGSGTVSAAALGPLRDKNRNSETDPVDLHSQSAQPEAASIVLSVRSDSPKSSVDPAKKLKASSSTRQDDERRSLFSNFATELQRVLDSRRVERLVSWHDVGNALDRFFFWLFFFATSAVNIGVIYILQS